MSSTFKKAEKLSSKKLIQELFSKGSSFYLYPFKVLVLPQSDKNQSPHQLLITVPKRNHKTAVARNRIKRQIREAYRLNKQLLDVDKTLLIAYIYTAKEVSDYHKLEKALISLLSKINQAYQS
ncbi:ribonuclease P protein component [Fulvivirga sp. RKSG066]|uniref:ribonuclease P protein component n=1 Tax=Fulvivirga aurantia TaxID=2529383 RepID=UPI0012BC8F51|nr:ribonuclease P protein component [Fulvivirga aurantia]MTI20765.1 ribonuclease P protein component [Fulvivirga aurantia]